MTKAIRFSETGGPDVLKWEDVKLGAPKVGEVRVAHTAVGLNFIDIYHRIGLYPVGLPSGIGVEGAGEIVAVGKRVTGFKVGDRVAYAGGALGSYSEERNMSAERLVKLPGSIDDQTAAAMMLQGLTVDMLIRRVYRVKKGDIVLLHAAAGGVGLIACQWLKHVGAQVIGTVGSAEKAKLAKAAGCKWTINYKEEDFQARVMRITKKAGVPVVYDSIGKSTFTKSLDSLAPMGMMVSFGNASGPVDAFNVGILAAKGSLFITRPTMVTYTAKRADMLRATRDLFKVVGDGRVNIHIGQTFKLKDAAKAQRALASRRTTGSTLLLP